MGETAMNKPHDPCRIGEGSYVLDSETSLDTLIDDAGEYHAYAETIVEMLAEMAADTDLLNRRQLIGLIGNLSVMSRMVGQCIQQAKVRRMWDAHAMLGGG